MNIKGMEKYLKKQEMGRERQDLKQWAKERNPNDLFIVSKKKGKKAKGKAIRSSQKEFLGPTSFNNSTEKKNKFVPTFGEVEGAVRRKDKPDYTKNFQSRRPISFFDRYHSLQYDQQQQLISLHTAQTHQTNMPTEAFVEDEKIDVDLGYDKPLSDQTFPQTDANEQFVTSGSLAGTLPVP